MKDEIPLKIDDTHIIATDAVTRELGRILKRGEFIGYLPFTREELSEVKDRLEREGVEAAVIPDRVELVHRLGVLQKIKNQVLRAQIKAILKHEGTHLWLLKKMPHHRILNLCIDTTLLCYIAGLESKKVGKLLELCLEASSIHSKWVHEAYSTIEEMNELHRYEFKKVKERERDLRSLADGELIVSEDKLKYLSHEIGLRLFKYSQINLELNIPELIDFLYGFHAKYKLKGENMTFTATYIPDYLMRRIVNLNLKEKGLNLKENIAEVVKEIDKIFPPRQGPLSDKIDRMSPLKYKPVEKLRRDLEKNPPVFCLIPEEFKPLYEPLWKKPLVDAVGDRYVVWDLDAGKTLYTDERALKSIKRKEIVKKILLELQELKELIIPIFVNRMETRWVACKHECEFSELMRASDNPVPYFGTEPIEILEDLQPILERRYFPSLKENIMCLAKEKEEL